MNTLIKLTPGRFHQQLQSNFYKCSFTRLFFVCLTYTLWHNSCAHKYHNLSMSECTINARKLLVKKKLRSGENLCTQKLLVHNMSFCWFCTCKFTITQHLFHQHLTLGPTLLLETTRIYAQRLHFTALCHVKKIEHNSTGRKVALRMFQSFMENDGKIDPWSLNRNYRLLFPLPSLIFSPSHLWSIFSSFRMSWM